MTIARKAPDAMHITSPGTIDEEEPGSDQCHRDRKGRGQRLAKHKVARRHAKKRRQKREDRQARGRITHDQDKPDREGDADHVDGLIAKAPIATAEGVVAIRSPNAIAPRPRSGAETTS